MWCGQNESKAQLQKITKDWVIYIVLNNKEMLYNIPFWTLNHLKFIKVVNLNRKYVYKYKKKNGMEKASMKSNSQQKKMLWGRSFDFMEEDFFKWITLPGKSWKYISQNRMKINIWKFATYICRKLLKMN